MAFAQEPIRLPNRIAAISIELYYPDPLGSESPAAAYSVQVVYSTGEIRALTGDLIQHLTQPQINSLLSFMDAMRTKAGNEIL